MGEVLLSWALAGIFLANSKAKRELEVRSKQAATGLDYQDATLPFPALGMPLPTDRLAPYTGLSADDKKGED